MMSWSCPFHSWQLPLYVPVISLVCPLHLPCMSRSFVASHFPTSPVVPIGFLVLCFPFIPPALPLFLFLSFSCPLQFPFVSLSFPLVFRSCRLPISSPHLLALPCISLCSPVFPTKTQFSQRFRKEDVKQYRVFPDFRQKEAGNPNQQRAGRGIRAWDPCFVSGTPSPQNPTCLTLGGGFTVYPLSSLKYPTRLHNVGGYIVFICVKVQEI